MEQGVHRHVVTSPCDEQRRTTVSSTLQQPRQSYVPFTWMTCITQDTVEEAISISKDLKNLLLLGGFNLTKWSSNSLETMKSIPKEDQNPNDTKESIILPPIPKFGETDEQTSTTDTERVLGIQWSVSRDSFVINSKTFKKVDLENPTQRDFEECFIHL